ncbi:MAG: ABC transporter permease [Dehalococcoidia bacterium]|nr:ABC transporter permease [Dehalococcoidia bacterium]
MGLVIGGFMRLVRSLTRRKLRTTLTIVGISVGIWALVVMSSMANKIGALVEGGSIYYKDKIIVIDATTLGFGFGSTPLPLAIADQIRAVPGVAVTWPEVQMLFDSEAAAAGFGLPDLISGTVAGADQGREQFQVRAARGRLLTAGDEGSSNVVLGSDLARKFGKQPGDAITIRGREFTVAGVLEPTLTAPDTTALLPLEAAQRLLADSAPLAIRQGMVAAQLVSQIIVYPEEGVDIAVLATAIENQVDHVQTLTGKDFDEQIGSSVAIFNAIILGVALISLIVGGLSVINTMAMSVVERTREIGIKRAIGASRGRIMREIVLEAGLIGLIGGTIGIVLGAVVVVIANEAGRDSGIILFLLTPNTAAFALAFSTVLGMVAGIAPAWTAARLDPVEALRYE